MKESIAFKILNKLLQTRLRYKGVTVNMLGFPISNNTNNRSSFLKELTRLKNNGLIQKNNKFLFITPKGKKYIKKRQNNLQLFLNSFQKSAPKNLIVMFDVPETKKMEREWFRFHLKKFGYEMIQKSVWVGPSPLPADFMFYIEEIKLKECIKTFKLVKPYKKEE